MTGATISAVVFDIGGVLLDWDPRHLYRKLIDDPGEMAEFLTTVCTPAWHRAHDLGADTASSCRELARAHPEHADLIMAWADRGEEMVSGPIDPAVEVLAELKAAGVPCLALSNMEADRFALRRVRFGFFDWFDGCVISGVEHVAKPDKAIFEILIRRYQLAPRQTVFVDDMPANVAAARDLGIVALRYTGPERLRADLRGLGLPVSAGRART